MIYLDGKIWDMHPMRSQEVSAAVTRHAAETLTNPAAKPVESVFRSLPVDQLPVQIENGVAVVPISGPIVDWTSYYYTSHGVLQQIFHHLAEQQPKNGAVLLIDSPGGTFAGSAETIDALNALQDAGVKVTAQVKGGAFSAAYKIASQCREGIFVHKMDEVGSIGTKLVVEDYSQRFEDLKIRHVAVTNTGGDFKTTGDHRFEFTKQQEAFLQERVDRTFGHFRECVQTGRTLSDEQFAAVSNGQWWFPDEAESLGLIDGVRTFEKTLETLIPSSAQPSSLFRTRETMADENTTVEGDDTATDDVGTTESKPETQTESKPGDAGTGTTESTEVETEKPTGSIELSELAKWQTAFGDKAVEYATSGISYTDALEAHNAVLQTQVKAAADEVVEKTNLLKGISETLGEDNPLGVDDTAEDGGSTTKKKSLRELRTPAAAAE